MGVAEVEFRLLGDALPEDAHADGYECREELSRPYDLAVTFSTADGAFDPQKLLRTSVTLVTIDAGRARERNVTGICNACTFLGHARDRFVFRAHVAPPIAALARREDCRIYQNRVIPEIVLEVLQAAGVDKVEVRLSRSYPAREYVVQYRESELDFVHRLLEDEGLFYFFEHAPGAVTMVVSDDAESVAVDVEPPVVITMSNGVAGTDAANDLAVTRRLRTSNVSLRDYDFERPATFPTAEQAAPAPTMMPYYEYPGGFTQPADGQRRVAARLRELRADATVLGGASTATSLEVGKTFTVVGAAQESVNGRWWLTSLTSRGRQTFGGESKSTFENGLTAIPEGQAYAPPRTTKRPRIRGLQTAVVTGPTMGEEDIHCDPFGRIKVRFHWDRVSQNDDKSSCWVRVMQVPLGGGIIIPRAGWEVAVSFIEGDPDKPIVVGRVYNAERVAPYALPAEKTSGALKSASSPGGAGANEIKLGDSGGGQGFGITAQKDLNVSVGNDQNETIAVNDSTKIKVNASISVGANQTMTVGGNRDVSVGANNSANVTGNIDVAVGGNAVDNATANYLEKVAADRKSNVGGDMLVICNGIKHDVTGDLGRDVGAVQLCATIASFSTTVAGDYAESVGIAKVDVCKGGWVETITGNRTNQILAAELDIVKGSHAASSDAAFTSLVGGLRLVKAGGDYTVKAPMITLLGATGSLKGGDSEIKMGGGPMVVKGSKITIDTALLVKLGTSLKMGPG